MKRITFARLAVLMLAVAGLALSGCGGDDNGGLSAEDMARIDGAEMAAMEAQEEAMEAHEEAEAEAEELRMQLADLQMQLAEAQEMQEADDSEEVIAALLALIEQLEARINQEGFPSTPTQQPGSGPQLDIGVEHVSGITEAAMGEFITNSPLKPRITPAHFLSESYGTERRHHNVAFVNGVAAVGFGGRQYLDDAETYGGWMEFNHFGIFIGTDDDGRGFTDKWSIGARSGSNPGGTQLEWNGAFVGREMTAADNVGDRIRGAAMIEVALGDPLATADARLQISRARLTITDPVNIDNDNAAALPYTGLRTGTGAGDIGTAEQNSSGYTLPIDDGLFGHSSDRAFEIGTASPITYATEDGAGATFTVEGAFYGPGQEEVGAIFNFSNTMDATEAGRYDLHGVLGADRRGN